MPGASAQVSAHFSSSRSYAASAAAAANSFIVALNSSIAGLVMPPMDVDPDWPDSPTIEPLDRLEVGEIPMEFPDDDSGVIPAPPDADFTPDSPPSKPTIPKWSLDLGPDPTVPTAPADPAVTLPAEPPVWTPPSEPPLLNIVITPFGGINTHEEWLDRLEAAPADLSLAAPTPFNYVPPGRYSSDLLNAVTDQIRTRLAGGTGLDPTVEQAIWDRARSREAQIADANIDDVVRNADARGFALPSGSMMAMLREAQKTALAKSSEISRDIAIKQAELEQANARQAIEQGFSLEGKLIDYATTIEQRTFDAARVLAENAVAVYNAQVAAYQVLVEKYKTYADIYRTLIQAETAKVEAYKAQIDGERAKVEVNKALIDQMRARIEVRLAEIEVYKGQLAAVQAIVSVEKLKVDIFGERVRAYAAEVNADTSKVEAFKVRVDSNQTLAAVYKVDVDAYAAQQRAIADAAKTRVDIFTAQMQGYKTHVDAYSARVAATTSKIAAQVGVAEIKVKGQQVEVERIDSANKLQAAFYTAQIGLYEAQKKLGLDRTQIISQHYLAIKSLIAEASKVGAQVNAQLAASALSQARVGAEISGRDSTDVNFNYSGATNDSQGAPSLIV